MYPITQFPFYILTAKNQNIPIPREPELPIEPFRKKNIMPYVGGLLFILFAFIIPLLGVLGVIFVVYGLTSENSKNRNSFNSNLRDFEKEKELYKFSIENYRAQVNGYEKSNIKNKIDFIESYRNKIDPTIEIKYAKKGKSEELFEKKLRAEFGDKILTDKKINQLYYPDFIYRDDKILLDIEIDEPYDYSSKEPIHFRGADDYRNSFFCANGYYVVRFAEIQIVKESELCVEYIRRLIQLFRENPLCEELPVFKNQVKRWSFEEAVQLSESSFRDNY